MMIPLVILTCSLSLAAAAPEAPAVGAVEIDLQPSGETVFLDGQRVGLTPLRVDAVSSGRHRVEVVGTNGARRTWDVTVQTGITVRIGGGAPNRAVPPAPPSTELPVSRTTLRAGAFIAGGAAFASLLLAGVLWASSPRAVPLLGPLPRGLGEEHLLGVSTAFLAVSGVCALAALALAALPMISTAPLTLLAAPAREGAT